MTRYFHWSFLKWHMLIVISDRIGVSRAYLYGATFISELSDLNVETIKTFELYPTQRLCNPLIYARFPRNVCFLVNAINSQPTNVLLPRTFIINKIKKNK